MISGLQVTSVNISSSLALVVLRSLNVSQNKNCHQLMSNIYHNHYIMHIDCIQQGYYTQLVKEMELIPGL